MTDEKEKIFVFGASGHAKVVIDAVVRAERYVIAFLADDNPAVKGTKVMGIEIDGDRRHLLEVSALNGIKKGIVAIGDCRVREQVATWLSDEGMEFVSVVHPNATIGNGVSIGDGTVVMAGVVINSDTVIGKHVIINTAASVDHDCTIGDFSHLAPGSRVCGGVDVGERTLIGAGATIIPNRRVGASVVIGAGSTVVDDIEGGCLAWGTPARRRK